MSMHISGSAKKAALQSLVNTALTIPGDWPDITQLLSDQSCSMTSLMRVETLKGVQISNLATASSLQASNSLRGRR